MHSGLRKEMFYWLAIGEWIICSGLGRMDYLSYIFLEKPQSGQISTQGSYL